MALIPPFFLDCVVTIGVEDSNEEKRWIGTGFLVGRFFNKNDDNTDRYHLFLVTNKHVLNGKKSIIIRANPQTQGGQSALAFAVVLIDKDSNSTWTGHPISDVDVAAIALPSSLAKHGVKFNYFRSDKHILNISQMDNLGLTEGDFVYVLGYPMGIVDTDISYVFSRMGSIARIRDLLEGCRRTYIIDSFVFPGNSGGPVISKPEATFIEGTKAIKSAYLIGIISSYIPYRNVSASQQIGDKQIIFEENSGLAHVIPTDYIMETIDICFKETFGTSEESNEEAVEYDND